VDGDGVRHEVWPITDRAQVEQIRDLTASAPVLIADGHHRFETALAYSDERRAAGQPAGDADSVMALVVELADEQLCVQAIHRLITGLPAGFDLVEALSEWFELTPTSSVDATIEARMLDGEGLALLTSGGTWLARPGKEVSAVATHDLDSSRLDVFIARLPSVTVSFQHGWDRCAAAVASGEAQAAVLLRPASISQIAAISEGGVRMPPKTTFFWPKPRTGMVLRELVS
jgi:uncharacterized protein (DUF1015 family)